MAAENHIQNGTAASSTPPATQSTQNVELAKEEVGWYFVERYYNTLSKNPDKLYLLYNKRSQFVAGVEEEKVHVSIGLKAIDDRVKELNYQDCKVRITNVDSQSSDVNIVVQVIGEMTNEAKPHRKFCQTFVLAPQPHGYFLLNDILRFIADEEDDAIEASSETDEHVQATDIDQAKDIAVDENISEVNVQKIEHESSQEQEDAEETTSHPEPTAQASSDIATSETQPVAESAPSTTGQATEEPSVKIENAPKSEAPAPAVVSPTKAPSAAPAASKPAVPLSWAQRIGAGNSIKPAVSASPSSTVPTTSVAPAAKPSPQAAPNAKATSSQQATPVAPARQPSPTDSAQDGSQGGWQTAGVEHSKTKTRNNPTTTDNGHVRAYVKNVFPSVTTEALKAELSKYGELAYFDVSRQKNSAFVEFHSIDAFKACIAANPHKIGDDSIIVEERRPGPSFGSRGPSRGGRGGAFDGRQGPSRGGFAGKDNGAPRGGFNGPRGGRGGPGGVASRGRPQAV